MQGQNLALLVCPISREQLGVQFSPVTALLVNFCLDVFPAEYPSTCSITVSSDNQLVYVAAWQYLKILAQIRHCTSSAGQRWAERADDIIVSG